MGSSRSILLCLFGAALCLTGTRTSTSTGSQALQCYSFEHIYSGPFDLSGKQLLTVSCSGRCFEAVSSLSTGYRSSVTLVKKGCWTGSPNGQMEVNQDSLPPDFSLVRGCATHLCNVDIMNHDSIPNLSPAPDPPLLSGTECYACVGISPEDCAPNKSRRVQCHQKESVCFQGNGQMTIANFSVPVYIRTCHRPSCTVMGTTSPWSDIDLQGFCCKGNLCNRDSVFELFTSAAATPQAPHFVVLLLTLPLLVGALGGPLWLSS
ncbi:ly6/PLAUR domain-containing protein 5 [Trichechus manatus latirostris]|uniref:Ly6/PLAUR domain-containing protein 5 n=1 Tax=Trichechus manatus latirostris TaxID=127582 RepID=A0A2Y9E8D6_TRIMA|nr:ly6/PLAUR domain-containing protein 5 [Trichechus manatus latirostris]